MSHALIAVIPSFVLVGPLAILTALFPGLFAGLSGGLKRWRAFMVAASVNSLLTGILFLMAMYVRLPNLAIFSTSGIAIVLLLNITLGMAWAGLRYRRTAAIDANTTLPPRRNDLIAIIAFAAFVAILLVLIGSFFGRAELLKSPTREFTAIGAGLIAAGIYTLFRMATRNIGSSSPIRLSLPGELVALTGMFAFTGAMWIHGMPRSEAIKIVVEQGEAAAEESEVSPKLTDAVLVFESTEANEALSSAALTQKRIFLGGSKQTAFSNRGVLIAQDRRVNRKVWSFTDDEMKPVYSTPLVVGDRLYVGEGLHRDTGCRMFCFDIEKGQPIWSKRTKSHTEGMPEHAEGRIYFSAGDDGLYCVNAENGEEVWHLQGVEQNIHIDSTPVVADGKVFSGSGYHTYAAFCLDAKTGKEIWRTPFPFRSFGTPVLSHGQLIYGLGTGNLGEDLSVEPEKNQPKETKPGGLIVALDPESGRELWRYELTHSVHTQLGHDSRAIYAACRDGWMYAIDRKTGKMLWRFSYGWPLTAGPVVSSFANGAIPVAVYVATADGRVYCHRPSDGKVFWTRDLSEVTHHTASVTASPTLMVSPDGVERTLYVPAQLTNATNGQVSVGVVRFVDRLGE